LPVDHEKDFLRDIRQVSRPDPQVPQSPPDELEVLSVNLIERHNEPGRVRS